jgi:hypothetical protein
VAFTVGYGKRLRSAIGMRFLHQGP